MLVIIFKLFQDAFSSSFLILFQRHLPLISIFFCILSVFPPPLPLPLPSPSPLPPRANYEFTARVKLMSLITGRFVHVSLSLPPPFPLHPGQKKMLPPPFCCGAYQIITLPKREEEEEGFSHSFSLRCPIYPTYEYFFFRYRERERERNIKHSKKKPERERKYGKLKASSSSLTLSPGLPGLEKAYMAHPGSTVKDSFKKSTCKAQMYGSHLQHSQNNHKFK